MKKLLSVLLISFGFVSGIFADETINITYEMPVLAWEDSSYDYYESGAGIGFDYRSVDDVFGFQASLGLWFPFQVEKISKSSGSTKITKVNGSGTDWVTLSSFFGIAIEPYSTNLVELFIVPGIGFDIESISNSTKDVTNFNISAGIDFSTNVDLFDGAGIVAGVMIQYQFYSITSNSMDNTTSRNKVSNILITPRAGVSLKL